jgi:hypothetical protein
MKILSKKLLAVTVSLAACTAICTAVWPQNATSESVPATAPPANVTAPVAADSTPPRATSRRVMSRRQRTAPLRRISYRPPAHTNKLKPHNRRAARAQRRVLFVEFDFSADRIITKGGPL